VKKELKRRPYTEYAFRFRKLRERSGHTQTSLSDALDTHQAVVCRIENNKKKIDMEMINEVAKALDKPAEEIFKELNGERSAIQTNTVDACNATWTNVQQADIETLKSLYEQLQTKTEQVVSEKERVIEQQAKVIDEKERYIKLLEKQSSMNG